MFDSSKFKQNKVGSICTVTYDDSEAFKSNSPVASKVLKEVEKYRKEYVDKATEVAEEQAIELFKKDSKLERVIIEYPFSTSANGVFQVKVDRAKTYHVPGKPGEKAGTIVMPSVDIKCKDPYSKISKSKIKEMKKRIDEAIVK